MIRQKHLCSFPEPNHIEVGQLAQTVLIDLFNASNVGLVVFGSASFVSIINFPFDGIILKLDIFPKSGMAVNGRRFLRGFVQGKVQFFSCIPDSPASRQGKNYDAVVVDDMTDPDKHFLAVRFARPYQGFLGS